MIDLTGMTRDAMQERVPDVLDRIQLSTGVEEAFGAELGPLFWPFVCDQVREFCSKSAQDIDDEESWEVLKAETAKAEAHMPLCKKCSRAMTYTFGFLDFDELGWRDWAYISVFQTLVSSEEFMMKLVEIFRFQMVATTIGEMMESDDPEERMLGTLFGQAALSLLASGSNPQ